MKVKITELEFDWDFPPEDPMPPDYETRNILCGSEIEVDEDVVEELSKANYNDYQLIMYDYLEDIICQESSFPIEKLEWEVIQE